jgi:hypothetical protein
VKTRTLRARRVVSSESRATFNLCRRRNIPTACCPRRETVSWSQTAVLSDRRCGRSFSTSPPLRTYGQWLRRQLFPKVELRPSAEPWPAPGRFNAWFVRRDDQATSLSLISHDERMTFDVPPEDYGLVGFDGDYDAASHLFPKDELSRMTPGGW